MIRHTRHLSPFQILERLAQLSGRSLFAIWVGMVVAFALFYFELSMMGDGSQGVAGLETMTDLSSRFLNALYFNIITSTTVGYGDLVPLGYSRALAATEGALGFFLIAIVISKIVSQKQELALGNVHKLAFQEAFLKTREVLYLVRRDCDVIAEYAKKEHALSDKLWSNLLIVFQKAHTIFESVPDFYDDLYAIDARREKLLLDSVQRTLDRFVALMGELHAAGVQWKAHPELITEMRMFVSMSLSMTQSWHKQSPHSHGEVFAALRHAAQEFVKAVN